MELPKLQTSRVKNAAQLLWEKAKDFLQKIFCDFGRHDRCMVFYRDFDLQLNTW